MEIYENRLSTFKKYKWPHLKDPSYPPVQKVNNKFFYNKIVTLFGFQFAASGFYCVQVKDASDTVCCYLCHKHLDGWEPTDDPWQAHVQHGKIKVTSKSAVTKDEYINCPLTSLELYNSRLATFINWPNSKTPNMKATPENVLFNN